MSFLKFCKSSLTQVSVLALALSVACTKRDAANGGEKKVLVDGSSTVFPITEAMAEEFQKLSPDVHVTVGVSGTGGGFKKFLAGEIDITNASRTIKKEESEKATASALKYIEVPVAYDGITIVVNKANDWVDHLTKEELKKLWNRDSKVRTWKDLRAHWPAREIRLYGPGTDSGTFDYFTEAINGEAKVSRADYTMSEDDNVLVKGVAGDKDSLGYFGYSYYEANKESVKIVPVDNGKGAITPNFETINTGTYAPLSRPVYIYVSEKSLAEKKHVADFLRFYLTEGPKLLTQIGFIPLPADIYAKTLALPLLNQTSAR
jgi:phosphate transport system substrate-binding protein